MYTQKSGHDQFLIPQFQVEFNTVFVLEHEIISVAQVEDGDFKKLFNNIWSHQNVEINLSCPNILEAGTWSDAKMFLNGSRDWCIAKVSPLITIEEIGYLIDDIGFTQIHFSNTLPISTFDRYSAGGLSGPELRPYTMELVRMTRKYFSGNTENSVD